MFFGEIPVEPDRHVRGIVAQGFELRQVGKHDAAAEKRSSSEIRRLLCRSESGIG